MTNFVMQGTLFKYSETKLCVLSSDMQKLIYILKYTGTQIDIPCISMHASSSVH